MRNMCPQNIGAISAGRLLVTVISYTVEKQVSYYQHSQFSHFN